MENSVLQANIDRYFPYLLEVRKRLVFAVVIFLVSGICGFLFYEKIIRLFLEFFSLDGINIVFTSPFQFVGLSINCGIAMGLIVTLPFIIWQVLSFFRPALSRKEFKLLKVLIPIALILFVIGFIFGSLTMKYLVGLILERSTRLNIGSYFDVGQLLSNVILTSTLLGLAFQFPIVLTLLMRFKILSRNQVSKFRPWAYLASFIFVLFLPVDDIFTDLLLTLPLIGLFEGTLLLNRMMKS